MPCSPISPVAGITLEALELYRVAHLRNPHLSIQAFVKTICDLHGVEFHRHISRQFSIALDIYLQIRRVVASLINKSLRRDSPDWRLKHACPACTYTLTDEEKLHFKILYAMDGNDSLKRILRRSLDDDDDSLGLSSKLPTGQVLVSDRYLSRNFVEQFAQDTPCDTGANSLAENSCEGRLEKYGRCETKKLGVFMTKTGVFVAVCRHGFCLLIADMVQSGERYSTVQKYPLAIVAKLLDAFGDDLGGGYDIGCQFQTTLDNSSLGPPWARSLHHSLPGWRLFSLTTYIKGIGIEDLETCERTFSKSNSLASALRYTSVFHCQQAIDSYFEHNDELEVYGNLSNFLHGNYNQALEIIANGEAVLPKGLTREPEEETLQMEYWQRLVNLSASKAGRLVANRKYQRALDRLEGLVVARIFELAKMNRAGTGALQTRSAAIRSALNTYNNLASAVYPPRQILKWEDVVEYAFLADFELLRKTRSDVSQLPWSSPAARSGMDLYFKMCRAREEICRLNIEVRRLVTYIRDEDKYLRVCEDRLTVANPALAHQIAIHRNIRGRFNSRHIKRLNDISKLPGFNGTLVPGLSACTGIGESASMPDPLIPANVFAAHIPAHNPSSPIGADTQEDLDEEEIAEEVAEEASRSLQDIITITADFSQLQVVDNGEVEE
ncbi:hypothetical protein DFJ58DRAFT_718410 [Suillus subalutaceus]|uniref:uncharacterized protein n=1 Tax=Suillus subalutaceus TaxID=48586 RepID=UPI001B860042|nr:uncharacterized protein DFJ58DRAFT_718410 [Suillus subalutaceus]KAG1840303.1 hypothetical protein DFJ58DRAFT_718410 [Suillus subalutaceus]